MYVSIDLGGTTTRVAAAESLIRPSFSRLQFENAHVFEQDFAELQSLVAQFGKIAGIGIGVAGDVGDDKQSINAATNLHEYEAKPIVSLLSAKFQCPVFLENDGVTAAYGEYYFGGGRLREFELIIWGSGIGGAAVQNTGQGVVISKLNWFTNFESWEKDCAGKVIEQVYSKSPADFSESEWASVMLKFQEHLLEFIKQNKPATIIFGGGISIKQSKYLQIVLESVIRSTSTNLFISRLGEDAGIYGGFGMLASKLN